MDNSEAFRPAIFPDTMWSVVLSARESGEARQDALERLCAAYWKPVFVFIRRQGRSAEDAEDLAQGFFLRILRANSLDGVRREQGRFRAYLLGALRHFLLDEHDKTRAQKRGGGFRFVSLDADTAESLEARDAHPGETPEHAFDRRWALDVLERAQARLKTECARAGKADLYAGLFPGDAEREPYAALAGRLGLTENAVKLSAKRLRDRHEELIRDEISQTVATRSEVDEEIRYLLEVLSAPA